MPTTASQKSKEGVQLFQSINLLQKIVKKLHNQQPTQVVPMLRIMPISDQLCLNGTVVDRITVHSEIEPPNDEQALKIAVDTVV